MNTQNKIKTVVFWAAFFGLFLNCSVFSWKFSESIVRADGWRFISLYLRPWFEGGWHWSILWHDHNPQPITALLFIFNAKLFNLNMLYEQMFSMMFLGLNGTLLYYIYSKNLEEKDKNKPTYFFSFLIITSVLFSLKTHIPLVWSLVSLSYIGNFFGICLLLFYDQTLKKKNSFYREMLLVVFSTLFLICFPTNAILFVLSLIASLLIALTCFPFKKITLLIMPAALSLFIQKLFFIHIGAGAKYQTKFVFDSVFDSFSGFIKSISYCAVGISSGLISLEGLTAKLKINDVVLLVICYCYVLCCIFAIFYFIKTKSIKKTILPLCLIFLSIIFAIASSAFRFDPATQSVFSANLPRYYPTYSLGGVGLIWIAICSLYHLRRSGKTKIASCTIIFCLSLIVFSQMLYSVFYWKYFIGVGRKSDNLNAYSIIKNNADGNFEIPPPFYISGNNYPEPYKSSLKFIKKHKLNVFSDNYPLKEKK